MAKKKTKRRASAGKSQSVTRTKSKRGAKPTKGKSALRRGAKSTKKASRVIGSKTKRVSAKKTKRGASGRKESRAPRESISRSSKTSGIRRLKGGAKKLSIVVAGALKRKEFGAAFEAINKLSRALAPIASITAQSAWNIEAVFKGRAVDPSDVLPYLQRNSESFDTGKRTLAIGVQLANGLFQILSHKAHTLDNALGEYEDNRTIYEENLYGETD